MALRQFEIDIGRLRDRDPSLVRISYYVHNHDLAERLIPALERNPHLQRMSVNFQSFHATPATFEQGRRIALAMATTPVEDLSIFCDEEGRDSFAGFLQEAGSNVKLKKVSI